MRQDITIAVDIGGTFTDVVIVGKEGLFRTAKLPSSRSDPSTVVARIFDELLPRLDIDVARVENFVHGTTVATNAVLERTGARLGILTTAGFEDVLEIGRQNRRRLYDLILEPQTPVFLAPGRFRRGVKEFVDAQGQVLEPLDLDSLRAEVDALVADGVDAIAICFLFSFLNPVHEQAAASFIRERHPGVKVSLSSEVDPAFREYERTCVTAFDAYVKPGLDHYLRSIDGKLRHAGVGRPMQLMQSRGGTCSSDIARQRPVRLFLSGPAAGVIGASEVGMLSGFPNIITVDIGGTSSDIALVSGGKPTIRPDGWVDGYKIRVPMVDVNAVGAGGGSVAWIDGAGGLRVGPTSAGAEPGPACYGRGGSRATVTDASVILGYLDPDYFAGGTLKLDRGLAEEALRNNVARPLGMTVEAAALGIHRIANAQMAEGIRLVSVKRGVDPREFALLPFGGAGSLHATALAADLEIRTVVFPRNPGVLSASGLVAAPIEHEVPATYLCDLARLQASDLQSAYASAEAACLRLMHSEAIDRDALRTTYYADMCYIGQAHYVQVEVDLSATDITTHLRDRFHAQYDQLYGHHTEAPARIVNLRVVQQAPRLGAVRSIPRGAGAQNGRAKPKARKILTARSGEFVTAQVHRRGDLLPGVAISGPAIVEQEDTTILIDTGWSATTDEQGALIARMD